MKIGKKGTPRRSPRRRKDIFIYALMLLPGCIYLIINNYLPMFGILIAFKKVNFSLGVFDSPWVGLQNFEFLFASKDAYIIIRNTICYNLAWIVLGTVGAIIIAILMVEIAEKKIAKILQPVICFPNVISAVILAYLVFAFLSPANGFINNTLLGGKTIRWYSEAKYWPVILTITYLWKNLGYLSIVYMAAIAGIDKSLFEAAKLDGASKMQQIRLITLPMIKNTIIFMTLFAIGRIMSSDFGLFYQVPMNSGMLFPTTQTLDTYVYRALMDIKDVGMSSAASVFQSITGFFLVVGANLAVRKVSRESALF